MDNIFLELKSIFTKKKYHKIIGNSLIKKLPKIKFSPKKLDTL